MEPASFRQSMAIILCIGILTYALPMLLPPDWRTVSPLCGMGALFFFIRRHRQQLSLLAPVLAGILLDAVQLMPLGVGVSAMLLLFGVAAVKEEEPRAPRHFLVHYAYFGFYSAVFCLWIFAMMSLLQAEIYPLQAPVLQWLLTVISYPLVFAFCYGFTRHIVKLRRYA